MNLVDQVILEVGQRQRIAQSKSMLEKLSLKLHNLSFSNIFNKHFFITGIVIMPIVMFYYFQSYTPTVSKTITEDIQIKHFQSTILYQPQVIYLKDFSSSMSDSQLQLQLEFDHYKEISIYKNKDQYEIHASSIEIAGANPETHDNSIKSHTPLYAWNMENGDLTISIDPNYELTTKDLKIQRNNHISYNIVFTNTLIDNKESIAQLESEIDKPIVLEPKQQAILQAIKTPVSPASNQDKVDVRPNKKEKQQSEPVSEPKNIKPHISTHNNLVQKPTAISINKQHSLSFDDKLQQYNQGYVTEEHVTILAQYFIQHKRLEDAIKIISEAVAHYPILDEWCLLAARTELLRDNFKKALNWLELNPNKNSVEYFAFLALIQTKLKYYGQAIDSYQQLLAMQPNRTNWQFGLARSFYFAGYNQQAKALYQTIMSKQPRTEIRQIIVQDMSQLTQK